MTTLTAARPVPSLLLSLRRAGWGDLAGRDLAGVRDTLDGLAALLPHRSGEGLVTVAQVADTAALSERWTRRCLTVLEDMGLIEWRRGGVRAGAPMPSHVRIIKRALVALIELARPLQEAADAARAAATRARIAAARLWWCGPRRAWSRHAALSAGPHPHRGGSGPRQGGPGAPTTPGETMTTPVGLILNPIICDEHGSVAGTMPNGTLRCPGCRARAAQQNTTTPTPAPTSAPGFDPRMRAAGDDTLWDES